MKHRTLNLEISTKVANLLVDRIGRSNEKLQQWLINKYISSIPDMVQADLFSTAIELDFDTALMLEGLAKITAQPPEILLEEWASATTEITNENNAIEAEQFNSSDNSSISTDKLEQVAKILNLAEMLFNATIADAKQRLAENYPDGEKAAKTGEEIFQTLRILLGIETERELEKF